MPVPSLTAALRRVQKAEAMLRDRSGGPRVRVDVRLEGEAMPAWPDARRGQDFWLVIDLTGEA